MWPGVWPCCAGMDSGQPRSFLGDIRNPGKCVGSVLITVFFENLVVDQFVKGGTRRITPAAASANAPTIAPVTTSFGT